MEKDRLSLAAGFMPPLCMALLMAFEYMLEMGTLPRTAAVVAIGQVVIFAVPMALIAGFARLAGRRVHLRLRGFTRKAIPFVIFMSLCATLLSFLLNCLVAAISNQSVYTQSTYVDAFGGDMGTGMAILLVVLLPSLCEELFFRGSILGAYEGRGTMTAIIISALTFSLVHGNPLNIIGPLAAGFIYAYMAYVLGSVWPAVFAHVVNNAFYMVIRNVTKSYESLGIWPYFILICFFVFAFVLYLSMRSLEKLIEKGKIKRFESSGAKTLITELSFAPGIWLLALMFIIKAIYLL